MTLVNSIDKVVEWLKDNVCNQITLKLPDDCRNDEGYTVEYVNPSAFPLFVPGKDRLPPSVPAPIPSVCVQLMEGSDDPLNSKRALQIRLCLACWNPGEHGAEVLQPRDNPAAVGGKSYYLTTGDAAKAYTRNMEGWRDSFNFADLVLRMVEGTEYIDGLRVAKESGIRYGLFTEEGNIWDYYPYWHCWISFTLEGGTAAKAPGIYEKLL